MPRPRELSDLVAQKPEAVASEHSEGATKGLRVTKLLSSRRSRQLPYMAKFSSGKTFAVFTICHSVTNVFLRIFYCKYLIPIIAYG